jgi:hypothetical protein
VQASLLSRLCRVDQLTPSFRIRSRGGIHKQGTIRKLKQSQRIFTNPKEPGVILSTKVIGPSVSTLYQEKLAQKNKCSSYKYESHRKAKQSIIYE